jgi:hypothetical protein
MTFILFLRLIFQIYLKIHYQKSQNSHCQGISLFTFEIFQKESEKIQVNNIKEIIINHIKHKEA